MVDIKINPKDTTTQYASKIFDSIEYIPLETTPTSSFGEISKLELTNKYFIILDRISNSIYFFLKDGDFDHKISNKNKPVKESYKKIGDFAVNRKNREIIILDSYRAKLVFYNFDGEKIKEIKCPFYFLEFCNNNNVYYFYRGYVADKDAGLVERKNSGEYDNLIVTKDLSRKIIKSYLPYNKKISRSDLFNVDQTIFRSGENLFFFSQPFEYYFYKINDVNIIERFKLIITNKNQRLPENFMTDKEYLNKRRRFITNKKRDHVIWSCTDIYSVNKNIITFNLKSMHNLLNSFLYDISNGKYVRLSNIYSDESNYLLPICERKILGSDSKYLYSSVSSKLMFEAILQLGKNKKLLENETLVKYFNESSALSNPVITKIKVNTFL